MSNIKDIIIYVLAACLFLFIMHYIYNWFKNSSSTTSVRSSSGSSSGSSGEDNFLYNNGKRSLGFFEEGKGRNKKLKNKRRHKK